MEHDFSRAASLEHIKNRIGEDIFQEHILPHLAFAPTPTAKIIQEAITDAIIMNLHVENKHVFYRYPEEGCDFPYYAEERIEDYVFDEIDASQLRVHNRLYDAVHYCLLTDFNIREDVEFRDYRRGYMTVDNPPATRSR